MALNIRELARIGAHHRYAQLQSELALITREFPDVTNVVNEPKHIVRRRRVRMSKAQRKAVSTRMKKYWAARRAER
jgi:hypothetical protein